MPAASKRAAFEVLVDDIVNQRDGHLTTGIFATKYTLNLLSDESRADVGGRIVSQTTFPGWGHMLENGATTLWEAWKQDERSTRTTTRCSAR